METNKLVPYVGTKLVYAEPASAPADVKGENKPGDPGYRVVYENGYESWSPKDVFEKSYRPTAGTRMGFGDAIEFLRRGLKVTREGWNGKGMFLFLLPEGTIPKSAIHDQHLKQVLENNGRDSFDALPSIRMKTADDKILTGWLASQTDMFATDWMVVV